MFFSMLTNSYALDGDRDVGEHSAIQTFFKNFFLFNFSSRVVLSLVSGKAPL